MGIQHDYAKIDRFNSRLAQKLSLDIKYLRACHTLYINAIVRTLLQEEEEKLREESCKGRGRLLQKSRDKLLKKSWKQLEIPWVCTVETLREIPPKSLVEIQEKLVRKSQEELLGGSQYKNAGRNRGKSFQRNPAGDSNKFRDNICEISLTGETSIEITKKTFRKIRMNISGRNYKRNSWKKIME